MAPRLEIAISEKRFGTGAALFSDFRLEIEPGSVVALLGPSGVGKSSLLRLVAGIDREFAGSIGIDGEAAAEAPMPGFVFQDSRLLPWLTALDNVRIADPTMKPDASKDLLVQVGLAGRHDAYPSQLSGGMQRRVALARALAADPELLLLDEPFVSLDTGLVTGMRALLSRFIETRRPTMLLVTHNAEDAAVLADHAIVLAERPARIVRHVRIEQPRAQRDMTTVDYHTRALAALSGGTR